VLFGGRMHTHALTMIRGDHALRELLELTRDGVLQLFLTGERLAEYPQVLGLVVTCYINFK